MRIYLLICVHDIGEIIKGVVTQGSYFNYSIIMSNHHVFVDEDRGLLDEKLPCLNYGIITVSDTNDV